MAPTPPPGRYGFGHRHKNRHSAPVSTDFRHGPRSAPQSLSLRAEDYPLDPRVINSPKQGSYSAEEYQSNPQDNFQIQPPTLRRSFSEPSYNKSWGSPPPPSLSPHGRPPPHSHHNWKYNPPPQHTDYQGMMHYSQPYPKAFPFPGQIQQPPMGAPPASSPESRPVPTRPKRGRGRRSKRSKRRQKGARQKNVQRASRAQRMLPIKCLFLDIEGVLTTTQGGPQLPRHYRDMTPQLAEKLLMLKLVVYLTRCKLVLTSAVRRDQKIIELINGIFKAWGIMPFYSVTPELSLEKNGYVRLLPENQRAKEVEGWLKSRNIKAWCVVDTMDLSVLDDDLERTVMVDGRTGLTREDSKSVLDILGVEPILYL